MKLDDAKRLAVDVSQAAKTLNSAISAASRLGLFVEIDVLDVTQLGQRGTPFVNVTVKVTPSAIDTLETRDA